LKVTFVTYDSKNDVGGASSWLQRLLPRLKAAGVEVEAHVLAFGGLPGVNCAWFAKERIPFVGGHGKKIQGGPFGIV